VRRRSFDPQFPSPVDLVHPREAEADSPLTLDPAIDLALLQPDVLAAAHAAPTLCQIHVWLNLHPQVVVVEVRAGHDPPLW
jgi:hypothetical protein